jgi:hypothetical protein
MARDHVGFDHQALLTSIFQRCVNEYGSALAAREPEAVEQFLITHFHEHGVPAASVLNGVPQPMRRCPRWPCQLCGLAFSWFEIRWYFQNISQAEAAGNRLIAAEALPEHDPRRLRLEQEADQLIAGLFSRPLLLENPSGRPSLGLARATAQHLRVGGFTHGAIGKLMGITTAAAAMRCWSEDVRSVVPFHEELAIAS